jgi:hypothetical protein
MKILFMLGTCHIWTHSDEWLVYKEFKESFRTKTKPKIAYEHIRILNVHGSVHHNNIPTHIQQDATLHSLFCLETALHVSDGTITHHQERKQLHLQHLVFVTPLLLSAAVMCCGWRMPLTAH